jgi:hypothetical protein
MCHWQGLGIQIFKASDAIIQVDNNQVKMLRARTGGKKLHDVHQTQGKRESSSKVQFNKHAEQANVTNMSMMTCQGSSRRPQKI